MYYEIKNGTVFVEINVPELFEYRTRVLRLEKGYDLGDTYLQPKQ